MQLTMLVRSYCDQSPSDSLKKTFRNFPVMVGRSPSCDYILQDVSKYISSNHAAISAQGNSLFIQDTSVNGIYINGSTDPIGRGNSAPLQHGDTVSMGDYCLSVAISYNTSRGKQQPDQPPEPAGKPGSDKDVTSINRPNTPPDSGQRNNPSSQQQHEDQWDLTLEDERRTELPSKSEVSSHPIPIDSSPIPRTPGTRGSIKGHGARQAYLNGAGLDLGQLSEFDEENLMHQAGALTDQAIKGIMVLLKSRGNLKNAALQNKSPLELSDSSKEAMERLLANVGEEGMLEANLAISLAIEDPQLHQLAMLDSMKATVKSMLAQFEPDLLEEKFKRTNPTAVDTLDTQDSKLWQLFQDEFNGIQQEALDGFNDLFRREFQKAYERRIEMHSQTTDS